MLHPADVPPIGNAPQPASHAKNGVMYVTSVSVSTFLLLPQLSTHIPTRDSFAPHRNAAVSGVERSHILEQSRG